MTLQQTRMPSAVLWLGLASLAITSWVHLADGAPAPLQVLSAPNLLRVGAEENVFVECQDCTANQRVQVRVMNYPGKNQLLVSQDVLLSAQNIYQGFGKITIPARTFKKDPTLKQYVYLQAQFPDRLLEKVVLVSFQSGYIFIQTDKTIYTPNTVVNFRLFVVTPDIQPIERNDQAQIDTSLSIQFVTPEGIVLPLDPVSPRAGIYSGNYKLPEVVSFGVWKVVASLYSNPQETFSAEFEVKEYVLPSFEVKLTSESEFFYMDAQELVLNIRATYLFGQEVQGTAYVVFGVIDEDRKKSFPSSLQRVPITQGVGQARLLRQHIIDAFPRIQDLVGKSLFASVSVLTESGSEMVEAEIRGIQIVMSPYTINFKKTPKFYKPGMSFDVSVQVLNPDGSPATRVPVVVTPGDVPGTTTDNGIAKLTINTAVGNSLLVITAKTKKENIALNRQATAQMTAQPYQTNTRNYIHIGVGVSELKLEDPMKIDFYLKNTVDVTHRITYLMQSKGRLVKHGSFLRQGHELIALSHTITQDMLPSFRIVAYYHVGPTEVVSDSVWVDVKDTCMGSLKLESGRPVPSYEPRKLFSLKVTGDPGATVGLVAVDKGVYVLNNKHRLTQTKVWDIVERYDTGCTPGGGANSMGVFFDAGLLMETSTASGTNSRIERYASGPFGLCSYLQNDMLVDREELFEPKCPVPARRRRAATIADVRTSLVSAYEDKVEKSCCVAGMTDVPLSYSCERRAEYVTEGPKCAAAFLHCCKHLATQRSEVKQDSLLLARSEEDDSYMDSNEITSRTNFPESWLWSDVKLPDCPESNSGCIGFTNSKIGTLEETPSYALVEADPVVRWLNKQTFVGGGYGSTQATIMVYQAVGEYWALAQERELSLNVDILLSAKGSPDRFNFNRENYFTTRTSNIKGINQDVEVTATGTGDATVTVVSLFYALPSTQQRDCPTFNLSVVLQEEKSHGDKKVFKLRIDVLYKSRERDAAMSILDIGLLTGFTPDTRDLDALSRGPGRTISKYEMDTVLSDRGSLIIYLDKVSHTRPEEISFRMTQEMPVGVLQPAAVSVYEYYNQTQCLRFYHPARREGQLLTLCNKQAVCTCAEENCSMQKKGGISNEDRSQYICETSQQTKIDYAYKVRVEGFEDDLSTDIYKMRVEEVIKEGSSDVLPQNKLRAFLSYPHCRDALNITQGSTYLIMGTSQDTFKDAETFQYVLGERTWIEYWPSPTKCQENEDFSTTCEGLNGLKKEYELFGCPD